MARRFDYLMYSIELAMLEQKNPSKNIGAVVGIAEKVIFNAGFCATD